MTGTYVLIDGNSVGYAEHYATKLRAGNMETQAVFGFVRKMREMQQAYANCTLIVLWDGRAQFRYDLWPDYKSNRDNDPKKKAIKESYVKQRPYIGRALHALGVTQVTCGHLEADDLAGYYVKRLASPERSIVLLTGDHDWMQLVRPGVMWRDARNSSNIVTAANFEEKTGYLTPLAFLEGKCLTGDGSDTIPGVEGVGDTTAPQVLAKFGSLRDFWAKVDSGVYEPEKRKSKTAKTPHHEEVLASTEGRRIILRNLKLMQLLNVPPPKKHEVEVRKGDLNREAFQEVCEELAFFSIIKNMDQFLGPFEKKVSQS